MKNIIVLYHSDCSDGFGAAWAAWKKLGNKAEYIPVEHDVPPPRGLKDKEIYSLDFCYTAPVLRRLVKRNKRVIVIDHHISAREDIKEASDWVLDDTFTNSGAVLSWKYFHPKKPVPKLLQYVEDRDLWRFKLSFSMESSAFLRTTDYDFSLWSRIARGLEKSKKKKEYIAQGRNILQYEQKLIDFLVSKAQRVVFEGYDTLAVNSMLFHTKSRIGHLLAEKRPPIGIVWSHQGDRIIVSLRSNGTVNVAELAARYGGGGHEPAAGFSIKKSEKLRWKQL